MQSNAHTQKQTLAWLFKYIPLASPVSKWSKVVEEREVISAKIHADNKINVPPSDQTQKEECLCFYFWNLTNNFVSM